MDALGLEGRFSSSRFYEVDASPPPLQVTSPREGQKLSEEFMRVQGRTEPGAYVKVSGKDVAVDGSGNFSTTILLPEGSSRLTVEAVDRVGNRSEVRIGIHKAASGKVLAFEKGETQAGGSLGDAEPPAQEPKLVSRAFTLTLGVMALAVIIGVLLAIL